MTVQSDPHSATSLDVASRDTKGTSRTTGALVRKIRTGAPVVPFLVYVILVLGVPTGTIVAFAFRSNTGRFTWSNIHTILGTTAQTLEFRTGFENSLKLAVVTAVIPGVLGTIIAYAISTSEHPAFKRITAATSGVLAQFGGVNLAFMFIATLAATNGLVTKWLAAIGLDPWNHGFDLYKFWGVAFVYMYFQIPLMVLIITPAFAGLRPAWREAAEGLGASRWRFWRHVGIPVLTPAILGSMFLLFGSGFSAYATAEALTGGTISITPIQIGSILQGNVIAGEQNIAYALAFAMIVILLVSVVIYVLLRRRTSRWLL
ncbi:MAG: binding-protein-dependent transport system inner rane component [Acidimicrobiaceae bacterium]|nr:binding-protein-dependent transport system inner rane component [Acidimicrobiaceae bacterium]